MFFIFGAFMGIASLFAFLGIGAGMIDPYAHEINLAEEDKRICEMTEGCNVTKAQERIDHWKAAQNETRKDKLPFLIGTSAPMIAGTFAGIIGAIIGRKYGGKIE